MKPVITLALALCVVAAAGGCAAGGGGQRYVSATITRRCDARAGVSAGQVRLTDPDQVSELAACYPDLDRAATRPGPALAGSRVTVVFERADGSTVAVSGDSQGPASGTGMASPSPRAAAWFGPYVDALFADDAQAGHTPCRGRNVPLWSYGNY